MCIFLNFTVEDDYFLLTFFFLICTVAIYLPLIC